MAFSRSRRGDGSALIIVLLLLCLGAVGLLAWQALDAAASHRRMAESVLRDYASLAADELIRRASTGAGYGFYLLLLNAGEALDDGGALPSPADLAAAERERLRRAAPLARYFFRLDLERGELTIAGPEPPPAARERLIERLRDPTLHRRRDDHRLAAFHERVDGEGRSFVFGPIEAGDPAVVGFEVELAALEPELRAALEEGPLLPPSLGYDEISNADDFLEVRLTGPFGEPLYRVTLGAPADRYAPLIAAERDFGDAYSGVFRGMKARVALDPAAAPKLVIGGLPRDRMPLLLALLALTAALMATAIVQLRRARRLSRLRSDFVSQVSHELRTPLTQIRMFAETLLLGRVRSADESRRSLEIIDREARRLSHLVENVLQFSRGERGTLELALERRELAPILEELTEELAPLARGKRVKLVPRLERGVAARVDAGALHQIVLNLLENAVKYGPAEQEVVLGLEADDGVARIFVDDQGPGVPRRERRRVWQSFRRLERDRKAAVAGTGIGLAVVRELVDLHGGRARVETGSRGGARFVVELPRAADETGETAEERGAGTAGESAGERAARTAAARAAEAAS